MIQMQILYLQGVLYEINHNQIMNSIYAPVEITDALLKMQLYITTLNSKIAPEKLQKVVILATETFLKFMENQEFCKEVYDRVKTLASQRHNYYGLLLLDQMLKNNKYAFKSAKRQIEYIFKGVWDKVWAEYDNLLKLENMKLLVKVWGYIYGDKYEESLKKWIEVTYKTKFTISAQNQAELKELYGVNEQPKQDFKMEQLIINMDIEQKQKKFSSPNESLLQALGIDQD